MDNKNAVMVFGAVYCYSHLYSHNKARGVFGFDPSSHIGKVGFPAVQVSACMCDLSAAECMTSDIWFGGATFNCK